MKKERFLSFGNHKPSTDEHLASCWLSADGKLQKTKTRPVLLASPERPGHFGQPLFWKCGAREAGLSNHFHCPGAARVSGSTRLSSWDWTMRERPPFSTSSALMSSGSLLEVQNTGPQPKLTDQNLHFNKTPSLMTEVVHTSPTIESNAEKIVLQKTHFLVWDIGGQEALCSTWNTYYANTEFIILVIDSTDRDRLRTTREELYQMLAHEALQDASVLIFANKQDMKNSMTTVEISQFLTLSAIKDHPWHIQGCCAVTGEGLPAGLQWMKSQATAN
ncbi:putative ADP-ribosylation factor-like protein 5C isoform X3 [Ailuropoda melanoleuca]|uniref:putative ADP-ribosylation factor-like protein 5C isoform X3 n=1 Tax=Ailuropoda melanoleuca TaxID=9646 RepID=UPI0014942CF5|nr:putative ADP-ribosylation factor-like protein 5C isoform X3 [Ailuropoda melanoleuca]